MHWKTHAHKTSLVLEKLRDFIITKLGSVENKTKANEKLLSTTNNHDNNLLHTI